MALAVHRAEVEEFIRQSIALFELGEDALQGRGEFAQASGFGPFAPALVVRGERHIREEAAATVRALLETGHELVGEDLA